MFLDEFFFANRMKVYLIGETLSVDESCRCRGRHTTRNFVFSFCYWTVCTCARPLPGQINVFRLCLGFAKFLEANDNDATMNFVDLEVLTIVVRSGSCT